MVNESLPPVSFFRKSLMRELNCVDCVLFDNLKHNKLIFFGVCEIHKTTTKQNKHNLFHDKIKTATLKLNV